jgi:hypothetical protein
VAEIGREAMLIGDDNVGTDFYYRAFSNVVPLSRSAPERIEEVRALGERAIPASGKVRTDTRQAGGTRRVVLS